MQGDRVTGETPGDTFYRSITPVAPAETPGPRPLLFSLPGGKKSSISQKHESANLVREAPLMSMCMTALPGSEGACLVAFSVHAPSLPPCLPASLPPCLPPSLPHTPAN